MSTSTFAKNRLFQMGGKEYRFVQRQSGDQWVFEERVTGEVDILHERDMLASYKAGALRLVAANADYINRPSGQLSAELIAALSAKEVRRLRAQYAVCKEIDAQGEARVATVAAAIEKRWPKGNSAGKRPSIRNAQRWYTRYVDGGREIAALAPQHAMKGNRGNRHDPRLVEIVQRALYDTYLTRRRETLTDARDEAVRLVDEENKNLPRNARLRWPTRRFVRRVLEKIPAYDCVRLRFGEDEAMRRFRGSMHRTPGEYPLQRVEIDHTPLDQIVIDDVRGLILGRPILTLVVDTCTRCILSFYIGFEGTSLMRVARALERAVLPKTDLAERFPDVRHPWFCYGVPEVLFADNGTEFHARGLEDMLWPLNVEIQYQPRRMPWLKGIVERLLGELNIKVCHRLAGTTFSSILQRAGYDSTGNAVTTLPQLESLITKWIVDVYHHRYHSELQTTPAKRWEELSKCVVPRLPADPRHFERYMGIPGKRVVDHRGVTLNRIWYNSEDLVEMRKRHGDRIRDVIVRVNPDNLESVMVEDPKTREVFDVPAVDREYASGLTLSAHREIRRYALQREYDDTDTEDLRRARAELREMILEVNESPRRRRRAAKSKRKPKASNGTATAPAPELQSEAKAADAPLEEPSPLEAGSNRKRKTYTPIANPRRP